MSPKQHSKSDFSAVEHGCIGALVGSTEQALMRPTVFWKAELQQDRFNLARAVNPRYCYRGLPVAVCSIAPITCIQFAATHTCVNVLKRYRGESKGGPTRDRDTMVAGIFAGASSSLVQSPFQLVEVNQQRSGGSMVSTTQRVFASHGVAGLYRGASMTAIREGIFCCGYIALAPAVKRLIREKRPATSDASALGGAAVISGTIAGVLSHPADTLKTRLQGSVFDGPGRAAGPREALEQLRHSGPGSLISKCYKGLTPRIFRLCCCTFIYGTLTDIMESMVFNVHKTPFWEKDAKKSIEDAKKSIEEDVIVLSTGLSNAPLH